MNYIKTSDIINTVAKLYDDICCNVDKGTKDALINAEKQENGKLCKFALSVMNENISLAEKEHIAACQDTGMAVIFVELGREVILDGSLTDAINEGVRLSYDKYFRKSVLDPITRLNTRDNTPAVIHTEIVEGGELKLSVMAKGFGSENMSRLYMLTPADGISGIKKAVIETVKASGGCACPPVIVGVGIGGTMEKACILAKKSLLRDIGTNNEREDIAALEKELLISVNALGIGAQGLHGDITALAVFIETFPTHLAGLPVAVNIQCHCSRHKSYILR